MSRILVVEDDLEIAGPLVRTLQGDGYSVALVGDGKAALDKVKNTNPDLIVLDLGLPTMDGLDVCRAIRSHSMDMPILILTARSSELDLVVGLDAGARQPSRLHALHQALASGNPNFTTLLSPSLGEIIQKDNKRPIDGLIRAIDDRRLPCVLYQSHQRLLSFH